MGAHHEYATFRAANELLELHADPGFAAELVDEPRCVAVGAELGVAAQDVQSSVDERRPTSASLASVDADVDSIYSV